MARGTQPTNGFEQALKDLGEAVAERRVESICAHYLALRRHTRGMKVGEVFDHVDRVAGNDARAVIVSAFSHRRCFMCQDGTTPCNGCDGTGTADGAVCRQCDGLGVEPCSFCLGAGWIDRDEIPAEIRPAVLKRQIAHVEKELARMLKTGRSAWASIGRLPPKQRAELFAWLIRLQARLSDLATSVADNGNERVARYGALAAAIQKLLDRMRAEGPSSHEPEEEL
jgi:hypothetical protein